MQFAKHPMPAVLVLLAALAAVALATPLPQTNLFGGGGSHRGSFGINHNFGDPRHSQVGGGVQWAPGISTGNVNGQTDLWNSRDGRGRVYAGGDYSRVLSGQAKGADQLQGRLGAQADLWRSQNGNTRVFTGAERSQVLKGPGAGRGETSVMLGVQGKF